MGLSLAGGELEQPVNNQKLWRLKRKTSVDNDLAFCPRVKMRYSKVSKPINSRTMVCFERQARFWRWKRGGGVSYTLDTKLDIEGVQLYIKISLFFSHHRLLRLFSLSLFFFFFFVFFVYSCFDFLVVVLVVFVFYFINV